MNRSAHVVFVTAVLSVVLTVVLTAASAVRADIPVEPRRPQPSPAAEAGPAPVSIRHEVVSKRHPTAEAKIVIPKKFLVGLKKGETFGVGGDFGDRPLPWTTVVAGIALSLAAASAVWLIRRRDVRWATSAALLVAVVCGAWNLAEGDLLVPGGTPRRPPTQRDPNKVVRNQPTIIIETPDDGEEVILILKP